MHKNREEIYNFVDSFVKLVYVMMKIPGEQNKLKLLKNVSRILILLLILLLYNVQATTSL